MSTLSDLDENWYVGVLWDCEWKRIVFVIIRGIWLVKMSTLSNFDENWYVVVLWDCEWKGFVQLLLIGVIAYIAYCYMSENHHFEMILITQISTVTQVTVKALWASCWEILITRIVYGRTTDDGRRTTDDGPRTTDHGRRAIWFEKKEWYSTVLEEAKTIC